MRYDGTLFGDQKCETGFEYFYLGYYFKKQGDTEAAIEKYKKVIELSPDYSWAYFNLGSIAFGQGELDLALEDLAKTLELNPRDIEAYKIYSKVLTKFGRIEEATNLIQEAIGDNPEEGYLYYILAKLYKLNNNMQGYEKALNHALKHYKTLSYPPKLIKAELDEFLNLQD